MVSGEPQRIPFGEAECRDEGWALKMNKRAPRMDKNVKDFLIQKFNQGASGRRKADPGQVAREIKCARDSTGKLKFKPEEWRTAQQISNFFQGCQCYSANEKLTTSRARKRKKFQRKTSKALSQKTTFKPYAKKYT